MVEMTNFYVIRSSWAGTAFTYLTIYRYWSNPSVLRAWLYATDSIHCLLLDSSCEVSQVAQLSFETISLDSFCSSSSP